MLVLVGGSVSIGFVMGSRDGGGVAADTGGSGTGSFDARAVELVTTVA